jgi:MtN3 and saliva related transmembrane protein
MSKLDALAFLAGLLINLSQVPQLVKTWRTRNVDGVSLWLYFIYAIAICLWLSYAMAIGNTPMILANFISLVMAFAMLGMILFYRR